MPLRNIFLFDEGIGPEDRLTLNWTFVLNQLPELGQAFSNFVSTSAGLPASQFQSAIDHPLHGRGVTDFPDMLLATRDWQVLFEHKLGSPCDNDQLGRYRDLAASLPDTRLAFMAPDPWEIDPAVLEHPLYLRPADAHHFYWADVYPLVAAARTPAAEHFLRYLDELGLRPEGWGGIGDPFTRGNDKARQLVADVRSRLIALGWPARKPQNSHWDAIEVRRPMPNIHLGYMKLKRTMNRMEPRVVGQAVEFIVWTNPAGSERLLPRVTGRLPGEGAPIYVRPDWPNRTMPKQYTGELYFTTPMRDALGASYESAVEGLTSFAVRVLAYVRNPSKILND